jgi:hypothetical protein
MIRRIPSWASSLAHLEREKDALLATHLSLDSELNCVRFKRTTPQQRGLCLARALSHSFNIGSCKSLKVARFG